MQRKAVLALLIVALGATVVGCKKKPPPPMPAPTPAPVVEPPPPPPPPPPAKEPAELERVYFGFDSTQATQDSQDAIEHDVKVLQENPETRVEIQGHADERGTTEYNLALGQRRAESIKDKMTAMGISGSRLMTISYGEERPLVDGHNEVAWSQNRRVEFRVLSSGATENVEGSAQ